MMNRFALPVFIALAPLVTLLFLVLRKTGMDFTYTLDDPYIHLALARNILFGNYGINLYEPSAPSSSILWPFLLVPFAGLPLTWFEYVPLILNTACVVASAILLDRIFADASKLARGVLLLCVLLATNSYGLVFTGMEHSLQVLLVIYVTYCLLMPGSNGVARPLLYVCLFLLPLVRYEGAAISFPVLAYLFWIGERRAVTITSLLLMAAMAGFSLYLNARGLGYVPSSILAKSYYESGFSLEENLRANLGRYGFLLLPITLIVVRRIKADTAFALALVAITALHFVFGKFGWFGRYEVYFVALIVIVSLRELLLFAPKTWWLALTLPLIFNGLLYSTVYTPLAASNIANQQRKMAVIVRDLGASVAVNDLGLVALESAQAQYVLDLYGLGSIEALRARMENGVDSSWMRRLMDDKQVEYAFLYPAAYPVVPSNWIKVGELRLNQPLITPASNLVAFFAASIDAQDRLRATLQAFDDNNKSPAFSLTIF